MSQELTITWTNSCENSCFLPQYFSEKITWSILKIKRNLCFQSLVIIFFKKSFRVAPRWPSHFEAAGDRTRSAKNPKKQVKPRGARRTATDLRWRNNLYNKYISANLINRLAARFQLALVRPFTFTIDKNRKSYNAPQCTLGCKVANCALSKVIALRIFSRPLRANERYREFGIVKKMTSMFLNALG